MSEHIFIVGAPRSGTTLLQRILSVHDNLFSIDGETALFTAQNIFSRNHFMMTKKNSETLLSESKNVVDFFNRCVQRVNGTAYGRRFVEKTPQHIFHLKFILKHFPKSRIIHITRDGRDCYCSAIHHQGIPQASSLGRFARYWRGCINAGLNFDTDPRVLRVQYESLVKIPTETVSKIMSFLNLEISIKQLDPEMYGDDMRSSEPEFSRLKDPITANTVGVYKNILSANEVRFFDDIAGKTLDKLGYDQ